MTNAINVINSEHYTLNYLLDLVELFIAFVLVVLLLGFFEINKVDVRPGTFILE